MWMIKICEFLFDILESRNPPSEALWQTRGVAKAFKPQFIKSLEGLGWMFMKFKIICLDGACFQVGS